MRELKAKRNGLLPESGVTVWLHGGRYELDKPFELGQDDSGTEDAPVVYRGVAGERPVLSGGRRITGWRRALADLSGLPAAAKGKVWVAEVPEARGGQWPFRQLWKHGERLTRPLAARGRGAVPCDGRQHSFREDPGRSQDVLEEHRHRGRFVPKRTPEEVV
ncbi:MAG: hypothetical protein KKI08_01645 [Armatimonadetes bacterium]|nr:hypothetical protein [Armatimonadota bacterium]